MSDGRIRNWQNSRTTDVLSAARREIVGVHGAIEVRLDQMDPTGKDRAEEDPFAQSELSFLYAIEQMLWRASSALYELGDRLRAAEDADRLCALEREVERLRADVDALGGGAQ